MKTSVLVHRIRRTGELLRNKADKDKQSGSSTNAISSGLGKMQWVHQQAGSPRSNGFMILLIFIVFLVPTIAAGRKDNFVNVLRPVEDTMDILKENLTTFILVAGSLITIVVGGLAYLFKLFKQSLKGDFDYGQFSVP